MSLKYKPKNIPGSILDINNHLSSITLVGLVIGKPINSNIKESLVGKFIANRIPSNLTGTKELFFTKQPLILEMVKNSLENECRDLVSLVSKIKIKTTVYET